MAGRQRLSEVLIELTDAELIRRAAGGEEAAFASLYRRRQGGVFRFALQMSGSRDIAEEVAQEAFITLARELAGYDPARASVSSYLFGIARNLVLRRLERERGQESIDETGAAEVRDGAMGPLEGLLQVEAAETVRRAVLALPESYREVVVLCDLQELSYADAAEALGCPVGTVRSKLNRGRALLAEKLRAAKRCFA